jgi:hypothetical protein
MHTRNFFFCRLDITQACGGGVAPAERRPKLVPAEHTARPAVAYLGNGLEAGHATEEGRMLQLDGQNLCNEAIRKFSSQ